ncbi:MAG TPA: molecular chaperone HtpG [Candidatus Hydrogenedentes bacterium]|nr:molecular chaperone HtpG [Candidatus Hydrogenedentota bacterium]
MGAKAKKYAFKAEAKQLLDLMIHSVYSNKDIFLRELISNSSDALDKRRFESVQNPELLPEGTELRIFIKADKAQRTLSIWDNGIGMSEAEVKEFIGTIAKSGAAAFLEKVKESKAAGLSPELIGQFGVGFYSTFMVADKVTLVTRRAGQETAVRWESAGGGSYTLQEDDRFEPGTTVTLHLKEADPEDALHDYTDLYTIRHIVKQYSDFVAYPIQMDVEQKNDKGEASLERETLNSMKAIWLRARNDVTEEEYHEFYKHISHDWNEPLVRIQAKMEGTLEYRMLLYIPSKAPFDLYYREAARHGVHLYVKRVFIMDDCKELLPEYLRFIRGVVDSEDLSLNISRELLQQNRQIMRMSKGIVSKVLSALKELQDSNAEKYKTFWDEFGRVLKEGLFQDQDNQKPLLDLAMFASTQDASALTSLKEYIERMKPGQDAIYYMTGESRKQIENSPHLEAFKAKGYEVLLLSEPVDEVWTQSVFEFEGRKLQSIGKGAVELGTDEEKKKEKEARKKKQKTFSSLLECLKNKLDEQVKEVRLSNRLTSSAACLVSDTNDMSPQLEQMMKAMGQNLPGVKRILELNPDHPILAKLQDLFERDATDPALTDYAHLLYGQAVLAEGGELPDPAQFSKLIGNLMLKTL